MDKDLIKLILGWIVVVSIFYFLAIDKGTAYPESESWPECSPDYMGSCN